jgi:hypothetical protein
MSVALATAISGGRAAADFAGLMAFFTSLVVNLRQAANSLFLMG